MTVTLDSPPCRSSSRPTRWAETAVGLLDDVRELVARAGAAWEVAGVPQRRAPRGSPVKARAWTDRAASGVGVADADVGRLWPRRGSMTPGSGVERCSAGEHLINDRRDTLPDQ